MKKSEILRMARELITPRERWCQGENARDSEGRAVCLDSLGACQWCIEGAIRKIIVDIGIPFNFSHFTSIFCKSSPNDPCPSDFNDDHTHEEVLLYMDRAIDHAEAQEKLNEQS